MTFEAPLVPALFVAIGLALRFRSERNDAKATIDVLLEERAEYAREDREWLH